MQLRPQTFYMDGEGVVCGDDGVAIFDERTAMQTTMLRRQKVYSLAR